MSPIHLLSLSFSKCSNRCVSSERRGKQLEKVLLLPLDFPEEQGRITGTEIVLEAMVKVG